MARLPAPRLLPITMVAMAALLAVKSAGLLRLAAPAQAAATSPGTMASGLATVPAVLATATVAAAALQPIMPVIRAASSPPSGTELPISAGEQALLQDLRHRRAELDARAAALAQRESVAAAAAKRLDARLDELGTLQQRLEALEAARKTRDEASWQGLVRVYEAMKPHDAAVIFDDLDMPVLLQVVDRMKDRKAAMVLAAMQPERARQLTADLAELRSSANRIAGPPAAGMPPMLPARSPWPSFSPTPSPPQSPPPPPSPSPTSTH